MTEKKVFVLNWRKAISELFLIVLGVSIALAADSWLSDRNEEARTNLLLDSLEEEWATELTRINSHLDLLSQSKDTIAKMLEARDKNPGDIPEQVVLDFITGTGWGTFKPSSGAHSTIMIDGIQNVDDPLLRQAIVSWNSVFAEVGPERAALAELGTLLERNISAKVARSTGIGFSQAAMEKDYWSYGLEPDAFYRAAIADDEYIVYQLQILNLLYSYQEEMAEIAQTLELNLNLLRERKDDGDS